MKMKNVRNMKAVLSLRKIGEAVVRVGEEGIFTVPFSVKRGARYLILLMHKRREIWFDTLCYSLKRMRVPAPIRQQIPKGEYKIQVFEFGDLRLVRGEDG